jgi:outer membrane protein OmpA-like peptidoglycan-associated protein
MQLSIARARTVRDYLIGKGIGETRLVGVGYGETRPIADNNTAEGRAANRRVIFNTVESERQWQELKAIQTRQEKKYGR